MTASRRPGRHRIYLETGKTWVFACALDWPGWCRRGKGAQAAIDTLLAYAPRYQAAVGPGTGTGLPARFPAVEVEIVGRVEGDATTDFGAPSAIGPGDDEPLTGKDAVRQLAILDASWSTLDRVVAEAPATLRKGPRGGGRDRDQIARHVQEAERAYAAKIGVRVPPRTPWPEQRTLIRAGLAGSDHPGAKWPARYALRRIAWHALDHLWEIEDRSES